MVVGVISDRQGFLSPKIVNRQFIAYENKPTSLPHERSAQHGHVELHEQRELVLPLRIPAT